MKKNRFLTMLFSLLPGAGHMYLGYMKRGTQYMLMFAASICLTIFIGAMYIYALECVPITAMVVLWLYTMFDSMHTLTRMRLDGIGSPADDSFIIPSWLSRRLNRKAQRTVAVSLIMLGVLVLLLSTALPLMREYAIEPIRALASRVSPYIGPILLSLILMITGARLMVSRKPQGGGDK